VRFRALFSNTSNARTHKVSPGVSSICLTLLLICQEYIPRPTANLSMLCIVYLGAIPELIPVLVRSFRLPVVEVQSVNPKARQGMKLIWLRNTVMV